MVSGQWMLNILRRQLFINTCTFLMVVVVVLHVSAPYTTTALTFVLKILTLILVGSCFEFHIFLNCRNVALAFPILAFTYASGPPCSSMMLPRYVKDPTSSRVSPSSAIGLVFSVLYLKTLVFLLCMLKPTDAETAAILAVFISICSCVCGQKARSIAKSKPSNTRISHLEKNITLENKRTNIALNSHHIELETEVKLCKNHNE
ncbi:unnamed protein product [Schistosoma margrebowiei]|uniref:Uncharacterized protein n=1 Tax=Schistosoma margrebowiei TaxID=48269 RepID=A0A183MNK2_9TREM|nr:unnamed protein product [Schistosoma margrebowiei]